MSKKNLFILAAGYLAGGLISSLYNKKKPEQLKKELSEARAAGEGDFKVFFDNFIDTHANLIKGIEAEIMTPENKKMFQEKKEQLLQVAESYKKEGIAILEDLKVKGKVYISEASKLLEETYMERKQELEDIKDISPEKVSELKENLLATFEEIKQKIKSFK